MMGGWIKIYQTIREHWIWERPRYLKWWLDLLMLAEWKDSKRLVKSVLVTIKRGQLIASVHYIVEQFPMPLVEYVVPAYYIISSAEASSNLSRYDGVKYGFRAENYEDLYDLYLKSRSQGFGMEVKRRIMLGNFVLSSGYYDAY